MPSIKQTPNIQSGNQNDSLPTGLMDDTVIIMDDLIATMGQPQSIPVKSIGKNIIIPKPMVK